MRGQAWRLSEDHILATYYPTHGHCWVGWRDVLPGRSPVAIQERARRLGVRTGLEWDERSRKRLLRGILEVAQRVGRSPRACVAELARLELWKDGLLEGMDDVDC